METYQTDKQLEIKKLEEDHNWNYRIVWGNPLNQKVENEIFVTSLNINGYGMSTSHMSISQYEKSITIEKRSTSANIVLED